MHVIMGFFGVGDIFSAHKSVKLRRVHTEIVFGM